MISNGFYAGVIVLESWVPPTSLEGLESFSHVWVVFVFDENTNVGKTQTTFKAKIAPPRYIIQVSVHFKP